MFKFHVKYMFKKTPVSFVLNTKTIIIKNYCLLFFVIKQTNI